MQQRQQLVIANWKMNGNNQLVEAFSTALSNINANCEVVICPPSIYLHSFKQQLTADTKVKLGSQNVSEQVSGAFTGELSVTMLNDLDVNYVIVGHSERRAMYGESSEIVADKAKRAIDASITPVVCIGESLEERESDKTFDVIAEQLDAVFNALSLSEWSNVVLAYEPVWAIGTGKTATPQQAQEVHEFIRRIVSERLDEETSKALSILYGGSVNAANSAELFAQADVDGGLVGGASLKVDDFTQICQSVSAE